MYYIKYPFLSLWNYFFNSPSLVEKEAIENVKMFHQKYGSNFSIEKKPSKAEVVIQTILDKKKLIYHTEFSFKELIGNKAPLRFDFAIIHKDRLVLVEYQGAQHFIFPNKFHKENEKDKFDQQKLFDQRKRDFCKTHKLNYIEFDYTQEKILEELVLKHFCD